ncbi:MULTISPECIES: hypothetical protein [Bacillales]|uniref:hypothetical protein n=1 Tax=Bacillales TaxID=1385 RepID=UPI00019FC2CB|nr:MULTISPECIES: hypothetical protein [Bacillales]EEK12010.1 hypothetical protein STAHO0001_2205 [Staphylococcus hominis SK119]QKH82805.1 hypothetical protein FOC68_11045 [Staphylococcus hominis]QKH82819.1 hypothetical protein FOC68_11130 [Staphylococcus hominis]
MRGEYGKISISLFTLLALQTVVNIFIIGFINVNNAAMFNLIATIIMYIVFKLIINRNPEKKKYIIKSLEVWNDCALITVSIVLCIFHLFIEKEDNRNKIIDFGLIDKFSPTFENGFIPLISIIITIIFYLGFTTLLYKIFKDSK